MDKIMKPIKLTTLLPIILFSFAVASCNGDSSDSLDSNSNTSVDSNTTYTVTFNLNYEGAQGAPMSQTISYLGFVTEPTEPVRIGYDFEHWATTINGTIAWNFASDTVTSDLTLFAIWIETEVQDRVFYVDIPEYWKIDGGTVAAYAWEGESHNFEWPGVKMNNVAGDVYAYTLPEQYTNFIFVRVSPNEPIVDWNAQTADLNIMQAGNNNLYIIGEEIVWHDDNPANVCSGTWSIYLAS